MWPSDSGPSPHEPVGVFEIEVLNAIKGENTGQKKKGRYFPNFFKLKQEISLRGQHILHKQLQG